MAAEKKRRLAIPRRQFLQLSALSLGSMGGLGTVATPQSASAATASVPKLSRGAPRRNGRPYLSVYRDAYLSRVAFPLGGLGAGMICLEGTGALSHVSLRNKPEVFNEPCVFTVMESFP